MIIKRTILFVFFLISSLSFAFRASTDSFNERIDNYEGYKEITIFNDSTEPKIYGFKILPSKNKNDKMYQWTHLSDSTVTIPPLDNYKLKIYSKSPIDAPKGQYSCNLEITPVILTKPTKTNVVVIPLVVNFKLDGYVGKPDYNKNFTASNFRIENNETVKGKVKNNCFANIETSARFLTSSGTLVYDKYIGVINKNKSLNVDFKLPNYVEGKDIKYIEFYNFNNSDVINKINL